MSKKTQKQFKNHKAIFILEDGTLEHQQILSIDGEQIETETDFHFVKDAHKYFDKTHGGFTYIFNLDMPSKVQAEELKKLRRSKVIENIMTYDREKPLDIMKLVPYVIAVVAIMF